MMVMIGSTCRICFVNEARGWRARLLLSTVQLVEGGIYVELAL